MAEIHRVPAEVAGPAGDPTAPTRLDAVRELRKPTPEAEAPAAPKAPPAEKAAGPAAPTAPARQPKRGLTRPLLFALLPIALVAGGYFYVTGGQIMSTDNAYIQADTVGVSTDVPGTVVAIEVHDNEPVKKGQVLYRLRQDTFQIALDGAKAQLGTVHDQVLTLQASYKLALAQIEQAQADLPYYQTVFKRQQDLMTTGAGTKAAFDQAQHDLEATKQRVAVAKGQADTALAQLSGDADQPIEKNSFYLQAKSGVDNAQRDFNDTVVRAPFDGIVTNVDAIQIGSYLQASQQAFSLVSTSQMWVGASPKETELTYVRPGQSATISVDTYPGLEWKGVVDSISPASGSSFSLLPAQNTTGNWVKVVQRIPMRVRIEDMAGKPPLRVGMSVTVDVDTGHARGLPDFVNKWLGRDEKPHG
ncbi:HlyD family secretion protein [Methylocapsa sp. S129]|uniref:HlyD family secretion protein n=1 Tax=Methylocapsa sp. S129 TaxID=1641869 RepID=UPI00131C7AF7|nr:HlyD family secretion protein [Methylocapsa sp. S129]